MIRGSVLLSRPLGVRQTYGTDPCSFLDPTSWVESFHHNALNVMTNVSVGKYDMSVTARSRSENLSTGFTESVTVSIADKLPLTISASALLVPIYVLVLRDRVCFSWDLSELIKIAPRITVDRQQARDYVFGRQRYSNITMFNEIHRLTERSTITVTTGGVLATALPADALSFNVSNVAPGVDVTREYIELLRSALEDRVNQHVSVASELSGGFDSSNVTMAAADVIGPGLHSYGLIFPGMAGQYQKRRRDALVKKAGVYDHALEIEGLSFLHEWFGARWSNPYEEIYAPLIKSGLKDVPVQGGQTVVLTGIGGDEAMLPVKHAVATSPNFPATHTVSRFPKSRLPETTILASSVRAPMFMRNGIWPTSPYCDPGLVEFSERLPDSFKQNRGLQRDALIRWGIDESALMRPVPENFESALRAELRRVDPCFNDRAHSCCVELGLLTADEWADAARPGAYARPINELSKVIRSRALEISLSKIC